MHMCPPPLCSNLAWHTSYTCDDNNVNNRTHDEYITACSSTLIHTVYVSAFSFLSSLIFHPLLTNTVKLQRLVMQMITGEVY